MWSNNKNEVYQLGGIIDSTTNESNKLVKSSEMIQSERTPIRLYIFVAFSTMQTPE